MRKEDRASHWDNAYARKGETGVSWYEQQPALSLELMRARGATARASVIDIGGGASRLVDILLGEGLRDIAVLDLSATALARARARLGARGDTVDWINADVTEWQPARSYDLWHDRATLHFLTEPEDRAAYVARLHGAVMPKGHAIIATFAPDGPERCSNLPVVRYDADGLARLLGPAFQLVDQRRHAHATPSGVSQMFQFSVLQRVG